MEGMKDHGRYSNLDHARYCQSILDKRQDPANLGLPGNDGPREQRLAARRLAEQRRLMRSAN